MRLQLYGLAVLASAASVVRANTEKVIFLAPDAAEISSRHDSLNDVSLETLTSSANLSPLRTSLIPSLPTEEDAAGTASWFLLYNLTTAQRYELRVCWAASQPAAFALDVFELDTVLEKPELMSSLIAYSHSSQDYEKPGQVQKSHGRRQPLSSASGEGVEQPVSILFLRVLAAAQYFSDDPVRMASAEPLFVDLILDPYVLNLVPLSLVPTAVYIAIIATMALFVARQFRIWVREATNAHMEQEQNEEPEPKKTK